MGRPALRNQEITTATPFPVTLLTIASPDIERCIQRYNNLVGAAVGHYAKDLLKQHPDESEKPWDFNINICLEFIKFGMENTILTFQDKYYKYGDGKEDGSSALTIGGYESAWLADLVASYILDELENHFDEMKYRYYGIYRDDGILAFDTSQ